MLRDVSSDDADASRDVDRGLPSAAIAVGLHDESDDKEGIELSGLDYQTVRNDSMVARGFEMSRRRDNLSFQHHAEVCALP
jgi:hypothetical protein